MLADAEPSMLKSTYFKLEAAKLKRHESILSKCNGLAAISETDRFHFKQINSHCELIFPFHAFDTVTVPDGCGEFSLFHGALHVAENQRAALWLISEVAPYLGHPLVIAGKGITPTIRREASALSNVRLVESPSHEEMDNLIKSAQSHLLPAFAQAGMRLKLLHALFRGRHVIANSLMLNGTQLHPYCTLAETADDFIREARSSFQTALDEKSRAHRKSLENSVYSNAENAKRLAKMIEKSARN
jgi:hypothetical protein